MKNLSNKNHENTNILAGVMLLLVTTAITLVFSFLNINENTASASQNSELYNPNGQKIEQRVTLFARRKKL